MNKQLFDDSDDNSEKGFELKTNEGYAKSYNHLRKKELLQKFKDKGLEASDSESSDDSDSSEEDEVLDPTFDQEFLKTLASLKSKDPSIYDKNTQFFEKVNKEIDEEDSDGDRSGEEQGKPRKKKPKPVTLKDYERHIILEKGGKFVDDYDEDDVPAKNPFRPASPSLAEEERRLREEFKSVMKDDDSADEEFGGIFKKREKSKAEEEKEEEDYLQWLAGKKDAIAEEDQEKLKPLKNYWSNDKLPSSEKFLRDYILNKGYTEANNYSEIPTYEEIVGDNAPLSEDEEELEKQAEFEHKFNFRFEEPDQDFIKRYPRTVESSVRRNDDKRKQKRQEIKDRKRKEKEQKMKELEMVKEMKRKEIEEKIQKLKRVTGNDELGFKDDDLDEDFDPEAHDRRMREIFNDDYYQVDEGEEKPECPSDIEDLKVEDWDNYDPQKEWNGEDEYYDPHCEDDDFNMDCDYDPVKAKEELQKELIENTRKRKGRKGRRNRFMELIKAEKPVFDPEDEKTYGDYIDEYYKLDCEDIIGDTPCRFKYVETTPNDFGLTIEEILLAKNKELNQWASLKKAIQIRPEQVEKKEQRLYKLKAKNEDLKRKIFKSLYGEGSDNEVDDDEAKTQEESKPDTNNDKPGSTQNEQDESKNAKKRRKRKAQSKQLVKAGEAENPPDGESESKKIKLDDHLNKTSESVVAQQTSVNGSVENKKKKKKNRKKKQNQNSSDAGANSDNNTATTNRIKENRNDSEIHESKSKNNITTKIIDTDNNRPNNQSTSSNKSDIKSTPSGKKNTNTNVPNLAHKKINAKHKANCSNSSAANATFTNKFKNASPTYAGSLPPLRPNQTKSKRFNGKVNIKFGKNKKTFIAKPKGGASSTTNITDERLKAYGINPKKFHKKQIYGARADNQ